MTAADRIARLRAAFTGGAYAPDVLVLCDDYETLVAAIQACRDAYNESGDAEFAFWTYERRLLGE